jgi:hypothetical protein
MPARDTKKTTFVFVASFAVAVLLIIVTMNAENQSNAQASGGAYIPGGVNRPSLASQPPSANRIVPVT